MPSAAELKGKYVAFKLDHGGATAEQQKQIDKGELVFNGPTTSCSVKVYTAASDAGPFTATPVPWSFTFLKYIPGGITTTGLNTAVMTGPLSGCFVFRYTEHQQQRMSHVGTAHEPTNPNTIAVKNAWKGLATTATGVAGAAAFPDVIKPGDVQKAMGKGGIPQVVAYFAAGSAFAMILAPVGNTPAGYMTKIAEVREMKLLPWANVANLKQFA